MRRAAIAPALGLALALAPLAAPAFARADVLTAPKIACVPLNVTHCSGPGKCKTRPAGAKDKTEVLVIDFRTKTATIRTGGKSRSFAEIAHERPERGERRFALMEIGSNARINALLTKAGRLTLAIGGDGDGAVAVCREEA